jgi:hypothetical protein
MIMEIVAQWDLVERLRESDEGEESCHETTRQEKKGLRLQFEIVHDIVVVGWKPRLGLPVHARRDIGKRHCISNKGMPRRAAAKARDLSPTSGLSLQPFDKMRSLCMVVQRQQTV